MNLHELRTQHPLRDSDLAAIRARVRSEIAQREKRSWLAVMLRFAFAAMLFVVFVPLTRERIPNVPIVLSGPPASAPAAVAASRAAAPPRVRHVRRDVARAARETRAVRAHDVVTRIEIQTADPTIRIIWLTQPKENNS